MPCRSVGLCLLAALAGSGCSTWLSVHGGYGLTPVEDRSVVGVEVRRAVGSSIHSGYGLIGARVDGSTDQFDAEAHVGVMRPVRLSERFTFAPSATVELARISNLSGSWSGGAPGPALGAELLWWRDVDRRRYEIGAMFGCMGGAQGIECPNGCVAEDDARRGIGLRLAAEYDVRLDSSHPRDRLAHAGIDGSPQSPRETMLRLRSAVAFSR